MDMIYQTRPDQTRPDQTRPEQSRIEWVDTAKGLGLILIIWGHLLYEGTWEMVNRAIYAFHMPMYFILSGFVAKPRATSLKKRIASSVDRLLIPSVIYIVLSLPVYFYFTRNNGYSTKQHLLTILFVNGEIPYNAPVWFFIVIFFVMIAAECLNIVTCSLKMRAVGSVAAFGCAWCFYVIDAHIPFGLDKAVLAMGFYLIGTFIKDILPKLSGILKIVVWFIAIPIYVISGVVINSKVSMYSFALGNYWLFVISGLFGSIVWFGISYCLKEFKLFKMWSKNTIFIVCTHYFCVTVIKKIARIVGIAGTVVFDIVSLIVTLFVLLIYTMICEWINRRLPILNGRKQIISRFIER